MVGDSPIRTPLSERLRDFRSGPLTVLVWLVAIVAAIILLGGRSRQFEYVGLARAVQYEVSATVTGQVASLPIDLYEPVEVGQVVALLDDSGLEARLATAAAELERLRGDLEAEAARNTVHAADVTGDLRRFQVDEEQLRLELLALRVELESDRVKNERLDLRVKRDRKLHEVGLIARAELEDTRLKRETLARRIEENEILLARTDDEFRAARQRRESFEARFATADEADPILRPMKDAIQVQVSRIRELEVERKGLVLRSPVTGSVRQVLVQAGQSVLPGEPLVIVTDVVATEVLAYLPEANGSESREQDRVLVARQGMRAAVAEAMIDRVGPAVEQLPQRLWRDPAVPEYGWPVAVRGVAVLGMKPGERVTVSMLAGTQSP